MNKRSKTFKILAFLVALFLVAGLGLALLHHHADGSDSFDCGVCQLARQIVLAFVLIVISVFAGLERREFVRISELNPDSRSFSSPRKGRAPPFSF
jgi:hypothetical protein